MEPLAILLVAASCLAWRWLNAPWRQLAAGLGTGVLFFTSPACGVLGGFVIFAALASGGDGPEILYAEVNPERARDKHIVKIPGKYELHRTAHRRPEMYGLLSEPGAKEGGPS